MGFNMLNLFQHPQTNLAEDVSVHRKTGRSRDSI